MKNKLILLGLTLFCCSSLLFSQSNAWLVPDARWSYDLVASSGSFSELVEFDSMVEKNGQVCFRYRRSFYVTSPFFIEYAYLFERNDSVFTLKGDDQFHVLYDFTRVPGDTVAIDSALIVGESHYIVVDTGSAYRNGIRLRYQDVQLFRPGYGPWKPQQRIWERQGGDYVLSIETDAPGLPAFYLGNCYQDPDFPSCLWTQVPAYTSFSSGDLYWSEMRIDLPDPVFHAFRILRDTATPTLGAGRVVEFGAFGDWSVFGLLQEDTFQQKVWFTRLSDTEPYFLSGAFPLGERVLIYDFSYQLGVELNWLKVPKVVLGVQEFTMLDGSKRRQIQLAEVNNLSRTSFWVAGMGGSQGLFSAFMDSNTSESGNALLCHTANGALLYADGAFGQSFCVVDTDTPALPEMSVAVSPNPHTSSFRLVLPETALPAQVRILDPSGRQWYRFEQSVPQMEVQPALPAGLYLLSVEGAHQIRAVQKISVVR